MDNVPEIVPMTARRYEAIPVDKIKVINPRNRDAEQFAMNVESIDHVGLMKPIRVNDKFLERTGVYELVCGEGRLLAHQRLGRATVMAEVVTCTRKEAYLQSLIENIARTKPGSMEFARELKRLHDEGWDYAQIARVACKSEDYIRDYIRLVEQGEERLIQGVEQGVFPISFAMQVARPRTVRSRTCSWTPSTRGSSPRPTSPRPGGSSWPGPGRQEGQEEPPSEYTVDQLKQDIAEATKTQGLLRPRGEGQGEPLLDALGRDQRAVAGRRVARHPPRRETSGTARLAGDFAYESP